MGKSGRLFGTALAAILLMAALFALLFSSFSGGQGVDCSASSFVLRGAVLNSSFYPAVTNFTVWNASVNITVYNMSFSNFGEAQLTFVNQTTTNSTDGNFSVYITSASNCALYTLKILAFNRTDWTPWEMGPSFPPLPKTALINVLDNGTIYLQRAISINLTSVNETHNISFSNIVFDDALGFPVSEDFMTLKFNATIIVPRDKNYTIMMMRPPDFTSSNAFATALPPQTIAISNLSNYSAGQNGIVLHFTKNLSFTPNIISGNISVDGSNTTAVNVTKIIVKLGLAGLVPPNADLQLQSGGPGFNQTPGLANKIIANYSTVLLGSTTGIYQILEIYGENATATSSGIGEYFAYFSNFTVTGNINHNLTLKKLAGNYTAVSGLTNLNTSYISINITDASGLPLDDAHVEIKVDMIGHKTVFPTFRYMADQLSGGLVRLPIFNDSNASLLVFNRRYAPLKFKLNITNASKEPNGIVQVKLNAFKPKKFHSNGSFEDFSGAKAGQFKFTLLKNTAACNVFNASVESCRLFPNDFDAEKFDPLKVMATGKVNLLMEINTTGVKLYFIGVDMLASGPPEGSMSESALRSTSNSTSVYQEIFKFGSAAPDIYDAVAIGMPYNHSRIDDAKTVNFSFKGLFNDAGQQVWNGSESSNASIPSDWSDYDTGWFNSTYGVPCNGADPATIVNQSCYINTTTNYVWVSLPHFTDGEAGPQGGDTTPPAAPVLAIINVTPGGNVRINWTDSPNETGENYLIFRSETNISTLWANLTNYTGINYVINVTNLTSSKGIGESVQTFIDNTTINGSRFFYAVSAVDASGNWQNATPQGGVNLSNSYNVTVNDTLMPRVPANISLTASNLVVTLSWLNVTQDVRGESDNYNLTYSIYRSGADQGVNLSAFNVTLSNITNFVKSIPWTAANSTTVTLTANGTYHFAVFTQDDGQNFNSTVITPGNYANITVTAASSPGSSSSSSSSSGGGGGTPAVSEGVKFSKSWDALPAGTATVNVAKDEISFTAIDFTLASAVASPSITVVKLDKKPTLKRDVVGKVYQYIRIDKSNIAESAVTEAKIEFRVEKKWFDQNSGSVKNIVLQRYSSDLWTTLETKYLRSDELYQYFEATSPGLSTFAVVLKAAEAPAVSTPKVNETAANVSAPPVNASADAAAAAAKAKASTMKAVMFAVLAVAVIALGAGAFVLIRKKGGGGGFSLPNPFSRFRKGGGGSGRSSSKSEEEEAAEIVKEYESQQKRPPRPSQSQDQRGRPPEAFN